MLRKNLVSLHRTTNNIQFRSCIAFEQISIKMVVTKLFRSSKQNRTALEKLRHIRDLINTCAYYLGFDILRSDFVIKSKKTLFFVTAVLSLIACEFYTIYFYMGNISKQLQSICVVMYSCIVSLLGSFALYSN